MTARAIPRDLRRRVLAEDEGRRAYCHSRTAVTGARPVIDHVVPVSQGGLTELDNLCLACHSCNEFKAARLLGRDPQTGQDALLFHPRRQRWQLHFCWTADGVMIQGRTAVGRATVEALKLNHLLIVEARRRWVAVGWHPPIDDVG